MRKTLFFVSPLVIVIFVVACRMVVAAPAGVDLADCADWDIVVDVDAAPGELYAAEEFQQHFQQATGARLPIVRYVVANQAKGIFMQAAGNASGAELSDLRRWLKRDSTLSPKPHSWQTTMRYDSAWQRRRPRHIDRQSNRFGFSASRATSAPN